MGNFLSNPITEKHSDCGKGNNLTYGVSEMQGWRASMEDAHTTISSIDMFPDCSFYAVYDGHGGSLVSISGANMMLSIICQYLESLDQSEISPELIGDAMIKAFMEVDEKLRRLPEVAKGDDHSGSTAIAAFITPTHIIVANTGDSRSVLGKEGKTVPMSFDHKPYDPEEATRIEKAGGSVRNKRVNGDLAVSRALGDFVYKNRHDLPDKDQQVSACPEIKIEPRNGKEEFLVVACDGIWDVMSNDAVCDYVRGLIQCGESDMSLIAEEMLDYCLGSGSRDNMTAIIVAFPGARYGKGSGVKGIREQREIETHQAEERQRQLMGEARSYGSGKLKNNETNST